MQKQAFNVEFFHLSAKKIIISQRIHNCLLNKIYLPIFL